MLRRKSAWVGVVGIFMCFGLWACTGGDPASLDGDFANADDRVGDGDTAGQLSGSGSGVAPGESGKPSTDTDPTFCTKIEGSQLGKTGVTAQAGVVTVTVTKWKEKSGAPGEYVGFDFKTSGGEVWFGAKAGKEIYYHWGPESWENPHIKKGGEVYGLSWIIFCEDDGAWIEDCPLANGDNPGAVNDDTDPGGDGPGGDGSGAVDGDGDGFPDGSNGMGDADGDGIPDAQDGDYDGGDADGDGIPNAYDDDFEGGDADGDGIPDAYDTLDGGSGAVDGDGDGFPDGSNGMGDADGDGIPDAQDSDYDGGDADGDGIPNAYDTLDGGNPNDCDTCEIEDSDQDTDTTIVY